MKRNESLQALRGIGFLAVFLYHAGVLKSGGTWGVSLFFILSGFLLMQRSADKEAQKPTLAGNIHYSLKKIGKLYPLHIFMTIIAVPIFIIRTRGDSVLLRAFKVFLNVTLLQSWFPPESLRYTMNNLSWFLSVMMFLYFMFPWIRNGIEELSNQRRVFLAVIIWTLMIITGYLISRHVALPDTQNVLQGLTYNNPIYRLGDFVIGCCEGAIYKSVDQKLSYKWYTALETAAILVSVTFILIDWNVAIQEDSYQWWKPCLYMLPVIPTIWLFCRSGGDRPKTSEIV